MGLRAKILLNAAVVFSTAAGLTLMTVWVLERTRASANAIGGELVPQLVAAERISLELWETRLNSRSFGLSGDAAFLAKAHSGLEKVQAAIHAARQLSRGSQDGLLAKDIDDCQVLYYKYRQLVDDTDATYLRAHAKLAIQARVTTAFQADIGLLRQSAFALLGVGAAGGPGGTIAPAGPGAAPAAAGIKAMDRDQLAAIAEVDRAGDQVLGLALTIQGSLDAQAIRPIITRLALFEPFLGATAARFAGTSAEAVLKRIAGSAAAMRNTLVVTLIQVLRLDALQKERAETGEQFVGLIGRIAERCRSELTGRMTQETRQLLVMSTVIAIGCGVMLLGAALLILRQSRSQVRAIVEVSDVAEAMARGNLNVRLDVRTDDEIGRMARSLNATIGVLRTLIDDLSQARDRAVSAERAKAQFLANMSHEIRTPMNVILGLTGVLLQTRLAPDQRLDLEMVHGSARSLLEILNDILEMSKIEAGQLRLSPAPMALRAVTQSAVALFAGQAQEKGIRLDLSIAAAVPAQLRLDAGRVRQILTNLLSNALKFTERGAVTVAVGLDPEAAPAVPPATPPMAPAAAGPAGAAGAPPVVRLRLTVADTGIGIAPAVLPLLFKPFVQADGSISRKYGGSGLGLTIVKQLCEMMGGSITLSSRAGEGSTVTVIIPAEVVHGDEPAPQAAAPDIAGAGSGAVVAAASAGPGPVEEGPAATAPGPATGASSGTPGGAGTSSATGRWTA
jgi:signal transduction histidine kinase